MSDEIDLSLMWGDVCDRLDRLPNGVRILRSVEVKEVDR